MNDLDAVVRGTITEMLGCPESKVTVGSHLFDDLGADSLDFVDLQIQFEEIFDIEIPDEDIWKLRTVGDIVAYLRVRVSP